MATSEPRVDVAGSERPLPPGATLLGAVDPASTVQFTFVVRPRPGSEPLPGFDHWRRTPLANRRYPSVEEFAKKYGAAQSDLDAVAAYARSHGLKVLEANTARRNVVVSGTAAQVNTALDIELKQYRSPAPVPRQRRKGPAAGEPAHVNVHRSFEGLARLPAELSPLVTAIIGLDNRKLGGVNNDDPPNVTQLTTAKVAQLYNFPNTGAADQTVGIFSGGGNYRPGDITNYFASLPAGYQTAPTMVDVNLTVDGTTFSNDASATSSSNNADLEIGQDIQISAAIAQGCTIAVYHSEDTEDGFLAWLNAAVLPDAGQPTPSTLTCSWLLSRDDQNLGSTVLNTLSGAFQAAAARGISVFIALGDSGSEDSVGDGKVHVQYPGSDPWVTSCGGTTIGNVKNGPPVTFDEVAWSESDIFDGATGGGVSAFFPAPSYQTAAGITGAKDSSGVTHSGRAVPDVAANASPNSAFSGIQVAGSSVGGDGTSAVAPLYAGLFAVINQAFGQQIGFINPLIYQLGESLFHDITVGNNDSGDGTPFFNAGTGWDACTGWGRFDGTKLINGIAGALYTQTLYFLMGKNTYGLDEVKVQADYPAAFWLVLEGFTPNAASGLAPSITGSFTTTVGPVSVGPAVLELPTFLDTPQRILFPCAVDFPASTIADQGHGGVFPDQGSAPSVLAVSCNLTVSGTPLGATAEMVLVAGADPYFVNINPAQNNVFYLSQDLRVFTVTPGVNKTPVSGVAGAPSLSPTSNTAIDTAAGYSYVQGLLNYLNTSYSDPGGVDPFTLFPDQWGEWDGDSSVSPTTIDPSHPTSTPFTNYNFAVARVRLNDAPGLTTPENVKVFFRLFASSTGDTDYLPSFSYPSTLDASGLPAAPLLGIGDVTIPFFATGNYEANGDFAKNVDYSANSVNNTTITVRSSGEVWAYFGCYLNVYATGNTIGGASVLSLLPSSHCCLVAEIACDDAPIPTTGPATPSPQNSDKLAQRNLAVTLSDNPGPPETHRVPQTFDVRPSPALSTEKGELLDYPDELMIDWGKVPVGSIATIYWPQVSADAVLSLAKTLYSTHQLSAADPHTIQCKVQRGVTYVPIPPGQGENFAGLFTIDLPQTVVTGQQFTVTVRRITTRQPEPTPPPIEIDEAAGAEAVRKKPQRIRNWRYVTGSFAVTIPVSGPRFMLPREESTLAVMKWKLAETPATSRWRPVLLRYIAQLEGRVKGLGGDPGKIQPSPSGYAPPRGPGGQGEHHRHHLHEHTGKIGGVFYDRFGDFDGFELTTLEGRELRFHCDHGDLEDLVLLAWRERILISVGTQAHEPHRAASIVLRRVGDR
jgi:Pro-kumamolisin, activation domain